MKMNPTPELITKLRKLLSEVIPEGKTDADTRFTDDELNDLILENDNIYASASLGWTIKAGLFQAEMDGVERYSFGQESEVFVSLKDNLDYALKMAAKYEALGSAQNSTSSLAFTVKMPEVL